MIASATSPAFETDEVAPRTAARAAKLFVALGSLEVKKCRKKLEITRFSYTNPAQAF
jgi:hypothetical protein